VRVLWRLKVTKRDRAWQMAAACRCCSADLGDQGDLAPGTPTAVNTGRRPKKRPNICRWLGKDGIEVVDVEGEIDIYTAPRLRELLIDLASKNSYQLVINMDKVGFSTPPASGCW
jgi:hypothetical protein